MNSFLQYLKANAAEIGHTTLEHMWLTLFSLFIAMILGLSAGILITRFSKAKGPVLGLTGIIQTIPSLALLGLMLPLFGIGVVPSVIALFLYALLPIVRNTFTGVHEVSPLVREAAVGMGMTDTQVLRQVELPLAMPTIFAGIRTAAVINVGVATLCAFIGAGGLGEYIFRGIQLNNSYSIFAGAIPAAILAIIFDQGLGFVQRRMRASLKPLWIMLAAIAAFLALYAFINRSSNNSNEFLAAYTAEFMDRADGLKGLEETYDFSAPTIEMEHALMYQALKEDKVDMICGYSTDGRIPAFDLFILEDDRHYFPPYYVAPTVKQSTLEEHPEIATALNKLAGSIDEETMAGLNYKVDEENQSPKDVALQYLEEQGFQTSTERSSGEAVVIGSKTFSESYILAEIYAILIENYTSLNAEMKTGLGGTKICFDAQKQGAIDIYPEYTGTAFLVLLQPEQALADSIIRDEQAVYEYVKEQSLAQHGISWLQPMGFNNTYALIVQTNFANQHQLTSITDMVNYLNSLHE